MKIPHFYIFQNKKGLKTVVSSLFSLSRVGGDKRDRTADLLNAILSPAHFSRKTGRKRPVFSGFLPPFRGGSSEQFHSDSTFFEGLFGGENGGRFSPTSRGGTACKALMHKALRAEEGKKLWENPGNAVSPRQSVAVRPPRPPLVGKSGYEDGGCLWKKQAFSRPKSRENPGN